MSSFGGGQVGPLETAYIEIEANADDVERAIQEVRVELLKLNKSVGGFATQIRREFGAAGVQVIKTFQQVEKAVTTDLLQISQAMGTSLRAGTAQAKQLIESVGDDFDELDANSRRRLESINKNIATTFRTGSAAAQAVIRDIQQEFVQLNAVAGTQLEQVNRKLARDVQSGVERAQNAINRLQREFVQLNSVSRTQIAAINRNLATGFGAGANAAAQSVDRVGDQFGQLARETLSVTALISEAFNRASNSADRSLRSIGGPEAFAESVVSAELAARRIGNAFQNAGLRARVSIGGLSLGITSFAAALGVGAGAAVAFGTISTAQIERVQIAFEGLLGSEVLAEDQLNSLLDLAARTPFEVGGLAESEAKLLAAADAMGIARSQIEDTLVIIGDLSTSLGQPIAAVDSVTRALGQMASRGQVMTEELIQLSEALPGFPVFQELAEGLNLSTEALDEMLRDGAVPAQESIAILIESMREFPGAAGAMERQSQTLIGLFSTLADTVRIQLVEAFEPFTTSLRETLKEGEEIVGEFITNVAPPINDIAVRLFDGLLGAIDTLQGPLRQFFADINSFMGQIGANASRFGRALGDLFGELGPAFGAFGNVLNPILELFSELAEDEIPRLINVAAELANSLAPVIDVTSELTGFVLPLLVTLLEAIPTPVLTTIIVMREFNRVMAFVSIATTKAATGFASMAAGISPVGAAVAVAAAALGFFMSRQQEAEQAAREHEQTVDALANSFLDAESATGALREEIDSLAQAGDEFATGLRVIEDVDVAGTLRTLGLTAAQTAELIANGTGAVEEFTDGLGDGGEELDVARIALLEYNKTAQEAAEAALDAGVVMGDFSERQVENALASTRATDGTKNFVAALDTLLIAEQRETDAARESAQAREEQRQAALAAQETLLPLQPLIDQLVDGTGNLSFEFAALAFSAEAAELNEEALAEIQRELGLTTEQLGAAMGIASESVDSMTEAIAGQVPQIADALGDLDNVTFDGILQAFQDTYEAAVAFEENIATLAAFPNVQLAAAQAGPEVAAELVKGLEDGRIGALAEMELLAAGISETNANIITQGQTFGLNLAATYLDNAEGATSGWQENLLLSQVTEEEQENVRVAIQNAKDGIVTEARDTAAESTRAYENAATARDAAAADMEQARVNIIKAKEGLYAAGFSAGDTERDSFEAGSDAAGVAAVDMEQARLNVTNAKEGIRTAAMDTGSAETAGYDAGANASGVALADMNAAKLNIQNAKDAIRGAATVTGSQATAGFSTGIGGMRSAAANAVAQANSAVGGAAATSSGYSSGFDLGDAMGSGFSAGLLAWARQLAIDAAHVADSAKAGAQEALRTGSPSKEFIEIGGFAGEGFAIGLREEEERIERAAAAMADAAKAGTTDSIGGSGTFSSMSSSVTVQVNVAAVPGMSDADARRQGRSIANAVEDTLARRRVRAEARIAV